MHILEKEKKKKTVLIWNSSWNVATTGGRSTDLDLKELTRVQKIRWNSGSPVVDQMNEDQLLGDREVLFWAEAGQTQAFCVADEMRDCVCVN